jgi:hypothetical protein
VVINIKIFQFIKEDEMARTPRTPTPTPPPAPTPPPTPAPTPTRWSRIWDGTKTVAGWIWKNIFQLAGAILLIIAIVIASRVATGKIQFGTQETIIVEHPVDTPEDPVVPVVKQGGLEHTAYWTVATEHSRWPDMSGFDIVSGHSDPDENGDAKVVFLIGNITADDLQLTYFNGYQGTWSESVKTQIITEIQDSVRPHVPGFTLSTVEIIHK